MAKLDALPALAIINGFKGTIDFYIHRGIPCARSWPRPPSGPRSPAVQAAGANFAQIAKGMFLAAPEVISAAKTMAIDSPQTWKDVYTSILLGGTYGE